MPSVLALLIATSLAAGAQQQNEAKPPSSDSTESYVQEIGGTDVRFTMVRIPGGSFRMGSPESESGRQGDEGPVHEVTIEPFWMGKCEVTWNEFDLWTFSLDVKRRQAQKLEPTDADLLADAVTRPSKPYIDMSFGMGREGYPAICMTQLAARKYCEWLSAKTGHFYRLPTEAEWEYACRAGTSTAYSCGDDMKRLSEFAWFEDNSNDKYQKVGTKAANSWGLHDMHGNVMEWTFDQYDPDAYARRQGSAPVSNPLVMPLEEYAHSVRGGSWRDGAARLRSASRVASDPMWKMQDPQLPQSKWYFTDALFVGFRLVRPVREPTEEERARWR